MHSETAFLAIFCGIVFITGAASGALVQFAISLHRTRRASLFEADGRQRGGFARSLLVTTRTDPREGGE
jgi:hypothetical protein